MIKELRGLPRERRAVRRWRSGFPSPARSAEAEVISGFKGDYNSNNGVWNYILSCKTLVRFLVFSISKKVKNLGRSVVYKQRKHESGSPELQAVCTRSPSSKGLNFKNSTLFPFPRITTYLLTAMQQKENPVQHARVLHSEQIAIELIHTPTVVSPRPITTLRAPSSINTR